MRIPSRLLVACLLPVLLACGQLDRIKEQASGSSAQDKAKQRVTGVLTGIQKGGVDTTIDVQNAICLWYNGKLLLDIGTLSHASDLFQVWQNEGHIARHIASFTVTDATILADGAIAVSGTIEQRPFTIKVPAGAQMSWIKVPQLDS